ncbi:MAG: hypothetical protein ABI634_10325 [Acidobacteriota bacterium]
MRRNFVTLCVLAGSALLLSACQASKSATPLSPSIAGPIAGVQISDPVVISPINGAKIASDTQPITFTVDNASSNGVRPLTYVLEIAVDSGFANKVFSQTGITPGDGRTAFRLPSNLGAERTYFWRVKAYDGANDGDYSPTMSFSVFTPVVIGRPGLSSPINGSTTTSQKPILEVLNAPVTGPAAQIRYLFEVAPDASMSNRIISADVVAGASRTAYGIPSDLSPGTRYFWRSRAFDTQNHVGDYSDIWTFVTAAATAAPPTDQPPQTAPDDQIDMKQVTIALGADVRGWAVTSTMISATHVGGDLCTNHTKAGRWPALPFFDTGATVEGNQWFFVNLNGKWFAGANEWLRPGQICKGIAGNIGGDNFPNTPLQNWSPSPGELLGVMVSTPARAGQQGTAERSNVVLIRW